MKHILYFASVVALAVVTSCGTKPGEAQADGSSTVTPLNINGNGNGLQQASSPTATPASTTSQPVTAPNLALPTTTTTVQQQPTTTASTAKGLNPAHGQPGHNCDIEVGAPLSSAPAKKATTPTVTSSPLTITPNQVTTTTTTTPTITSAPSTVKTAPGMNPPHGQPGHKCEIEVGAPLNSKPKTAAATTTSPTTTPTVNSNVTPGSIKPSIVNTTPTITTPTTTATAVKTAPGMNPAHGQPGHRCEIAVGAPLDSKPEPLKVVTPEKKN